MMLFLTSVAAVCLDKITPYLPQYKPGLKVAFIPTAGSLYQYAPWQDMDKEKLEEMGFEVIIVEIKGQTRQALREKLSDIDILFVAGGNTFYLLEHAVKSGFFEIAKELVKKGVIYIGSSAGSVLAGPSLEPVKVFDDPSVAALASYAGLGLVDFVVLPHYGNRDEMPKYEQVQSDYKDKYKCIPLHDDQVILVTEEGYKII